MKHAVKQVKKMRATHELHLMTKSWQNSLGKSKGMSLLWFFKPICTITITTESGSIEVLPQNSIRELFFIFFPNLGKVHTLRFINEYMASILNKAYLEMQKN